MLGECSANKVQSIINQNKQLQKACADLEHVSNAEHYIHVHMKRSVPQSMPPLFRGCTLSPQVRNDVELTTLHDRGKPGRGSIKEELSYLLPRPQQPWPGPGEDQEVKLGVSKGPAPSSMHPCQAHLMIRPLRCLQSISGGLLPKRCFRRVGHREIVFI